MSRNPKVIVTNHFTLRFQFGTHRSVFLGRFCWQRHRWLEVDQFPQTLRRLRPMGAFRRTIEQLSVRYNRQDGLARPQFSKSQQNFFRPPLSNVNADIRVQQKAGFHHSPLRFCG
ncbi:MAG: hypothetical protein WAL56_17490 [Candidatus Sulfotelmatobacter sp.]